MAAPAAFASSFQAAELSYDGALLSQFNLINLGSFSGTGSNSVGGRVVVGGDLRLSGGSTESVCANAACSSNSALGVASTPTNVVSATSASSNNGYQNPNYGYGALTVFGRVMNTNAAAGAIGVSAANGGDVDIAGAITAASSSGTAGTVTVKNGGINVGGAVAANSMGVSGAYSEVRATTAANVPSGPNIQNNATIAEVFAPFANPSASVATDFTNPLTDLSRGLASLPGTKQTLPQNGSVLLSSVGFTGANGKTYGVVTATIDQLTSSNFKGVQNGAGLAATFVIVTGNTTSSLVGLTNSQDSTYGTGNGAFTNVLYNFVDATSLNFAGQFNSSILAPLATISSMGGAINGSVVVQSMNQTQALNSGNAFTGDLSGLNNLGQFRRVPEPASMTLLGLGFGAAALARLRRRRSAAAAPKAD